MTISAVSITNAALIKVGADVISALSESTRSAILANKIFEPLRDEVQSAHPWKFTLTRTTLDGIIAGTPSWGFDNIFNLPNDYLCLWKTDPLSINYVIEQSQLLTNEISVDILYGARNTDPSSWSPLYAESLSCRMAKELAMALKQSLNLSQYWGTMYEKTLSQARWQDSVGAPIDAIEADTWTKKRL